MPLSRNHGNANAIVLANASQPESGGEQRPRVPQDQGVSRKKRPYLLKMLQHHLGSHIVSDTLDWDGESCAFPSLPLGCQLGEKL